MCEITFDGSLARDVVFKQVLGLMTLEETTDKTKYTISVLFSSFEIENTHPHSGSQER